MELNSDKDYYQKYIQYKRQYIMLKQLKNNNNYNNYNNYNNELEGGNWSWFGFGENKAKKEQKEQKIQAAQDLRNAQAESEKLALEEAQKYVGDGTYLVFEVSNLNIINYPNLRALNYDNEKRKQPKENTDKDIIILDKIEFSRLYQNAYIVIKDKDKYTYKFITDDDNNFQTDYNNILSEIENIKKNECDCMTEAITATNNARLINLISELNSQIQAYNTNYRTTENQNKNIRNNVLDSLINSGEHQKYAEHVLQYNEHEFTATTNDTFLTEINNHIVSRINDEQKQSEGKLNMILKIKNDYQTSDVYTFDGIITKDDASYTITYAKIASIISEYDLSVKNKSMAISAPTPFKTKIQ